MTKDELRPLLKRAFDAGRADALREPARTFSADSATQFASAFSAADVPKLHDYFAADSDGHFVGSLHRKFGMNVREFADAAGMRRRQLWESGKGRWVWAKREEAAKPFSEDAQGHEHDSRDGKFAKKGGEKGATTEASRTATVDPQKPPPTVAAAGEKWRESLTSEDRAALAHYISADHESSPLQAFKLNRSIREGKATPEQAARHELIARAVTTAPKLAAPIRVFRGMSLGPTATAAMVADLRAKARGGSQLDLRSVTNTSFSPSYVAQEFGAGSPDRETVIFEFDTDSGAFADAVSPHGASQGEVLVAPGSYDVVAVERVPFGPKQKPAWVATLRVRAHAAKPFSEDAQGHEHDSRDGRFVSKGGKPSRAERKAARRDKTRTKRADEVRKSLQTAARSAPHAAASAAITAATDSAAAAAASKTRAEFAKHAAAAVRAAHARAESAAKVVSKDIAQDFVRKFAKELEPAGLTKNDLERVAKILAPETARHIAYAADLRDEVADRGHDWESADRSESVKELRELIESVGRAPEETGNWEMGTHALADEMNEAGVLADPKEPGESASDGDWDAYEKEQEATSTKREQLAFSLLARWAVAAGWSKDVDAGAGWATKQQFSEDARGNEPRAKDTPPATEPDEPGWDGLAPEGDEPPELDAPDDEAPLPEPDTETDTFAEGAKLTGEKRDSLGRRRCYDNGKLVKCPRQEEKPGSTGAAWDKPDWIEAPAKGAKPKWVHGETGAVRYGERPNETAAEEKQRRHAERTRRLARPTDVTAAPDVTADAARWAGSGEDAERVFAEAIGAHNGAEVTVTGNGAHYALSVDHPDATHWSRTLRVNADGTLSVRNSLFFLKPGARGGGFGLEVFSGQVRKLFAAGGTEITTCAGKGGSGGEKMNGYYTWARMGYDADLEDDYRRRLKAKAEHALAAEDAELRAKGKPVPAGTPAERAAALVAAGPKSVQDLMGTEDGRAVWRRTGYMTGMRFDLAPGSKSLAVLNSYLASKGKPPVDDTSPEAVAHRDAVIAQRKELLAKNPPPAPPAQKSPPERIRDIAREVHDARRAELERLGLYDAVAPGALASAADHADHYAGDRAARFDPAASRQAIDNVLLYRMQRAGEERYAQFFADPAHRDVHDAFANRAEELGFDPQAVRAHAKRATNYLPDPRRALSNSYEAAIDALVEHRADGVRDALRAHAKHDTPLGEELHEKARAAGLNPVKVRNAAFQFGARSRDAGRALASDPAGAARLAFDAAISRLREKNRPIDPAPATFSDEPGPPPFPGAVLMGEPRRWHNPHTGEHVGASEHHDTAARLAHASDIPDALKKEYAGHLAAVLAKMPETSRSAIRDALTYDYPAGAKVVFHPNTAALGAAVRAKGFRVAKGEEVAGAVVFHPKLFSEVELHLDGAGADSTAEGVYAHELGHLVALGIAQRSPKNGGGALLSADPKWVGAWKAEIKNGTGDKKLSRYAREDEHEGLAELYRHLHERGADDARKRWPKSVKYLESKGLLT